VTGFMVTIGFSVWTSAAVVSSGALGKVVGSSVCACVTDFVVSIGIRVDGFLVEVDSIGSVLATNSVVSSTVAGSVLNFGTFVVATLLVEGDLVDSVWMPVVVRC